MSATSTLTSAEKHRRAQLYARFTYAGIIVIFLSVCAIAVLSTMQSEANKETFKAIHVSKPISFIDYTYVDKKASPKKAE
jgi:hypothetical protein